MFVVAQNDFAILTSCCISRLYFRATDELNSDLKQTLSSVYKKIQKNYIAFTSTPYIYTTKTSPVLETAQWQLTIGSTPKPKQAHRTIIANRLNLAVRYQPLQMS